MDSEKDCIWKCKLTVGPITHSSVLKTKKIQCRKLCPSGKLEFGVHVLNPWGEVNRRLLVLIWHLCLLTNNETGNICTAMILHKRHVLTPRTIANLWSLTQRHSRTWNSMFLVLFWQAVPFVSWYVVLLKNNATSGMIDRSVSSVESRMQHIICWNSVLILRCMSGSCHIYSIYCWISTSEHRPNHKTNPCQSLYFKLQACEKKCIRRS